jgi:iron complex outermembrane recepter protein
MQSFVPSIRAATAALTMIVLAAAAPPAAVAQSPRVEPGHVTGRVVDVQTGEAIGTATVRLLEARRMMAADPEGRFLFRDLPPGSYTVVAERIGYAPATQTVRVADGATASVLLELRVSALALPGVVVTGTGRARGAAETYQPTDVLAGAALRRALGTTVTATIADLPGISEQFNGPAASQPVIRGMGGDRVLVLEDGQRTGDMYSTAPDHAVAIDPLTAEQVEVVRGPAGLLYGSNALGGVVNVIREEVPASLPDRRIVTAIAQGESAFRGVATGATVLAPAGRFALRAELSGRRTDDTRTPLGTLESTALNATNAGLGASLITGWGHVGSSVRHYRMGYGVPGEFAGERIPGAHEGGVEIEAQRLVARFDAAHRASPGPFRSIELHTGLTHYLHDEIEGRAEDGTPWVGTTFDQLSGELRLVGRHDHMNGRLLREGAVGLDVRTRDLRAGGSSPGLRSAREHAAAAYIYEELGRGAWRLQAGARYDVSQVSPYFHDPIIVGSGSSVREIPVRDRSFGAFSGSAALLWTATSQFTIGVNAARSFRAPAIGELYSDGPHLADYSFDIGNPELGAETGHGLDIFARFAAPTVQAEIAAFANAVSDYIYYEATGDVDPRFRRFPVFTARSHDALFRGFEGRAQVEPLRHLVLDANASLVIAARRATGDPLPGIPPFNGGAEVRYERTAWFASLGWRGAAPQNRVPREILSPVREGEAIRPQEPTAGYGLWNAGAGVRWSAAGQEHSVTLNVRNAFDAVWRDHLSRTKDIAPQPGRNVQLLYRVRL